MVMGAPRRLLVGRGRANEDILAGPPGEQVYISKRLVLSPD